MSDPRSHIGKTFVAIHHEMFRVGKAARITGVVTCNGRECYELLYPDGFIDSTPVKNEDFVGKGGEGIFYRIEDAP